MTQYTRLVHFTAASNYLIASARGQTETRAFYRISNFFVASRMGLAASGSNFFVAATEKLPVRTLSYNAVFSIRATKKLSD
jgi:hypothetical protein